MKNFIATLFIIPFSVIIGVIFLIAMVSSILIDCVSKRVSKKSSPEEGMHPERVVESPDEKN